MFNAVLNKRITSDGFTNFKWELLIATYSITNHVCAVNSSTIKSKRFLSLKTLINWIYQFGLKRLT